MFSNKYSWIPTTNFSLLFIAISLSNGCTNWKTNISKRLDIHQGTNCIFLLSVDYTSSALMHLFFHDTCSSCTSTSPIHLIHRRYHWLHTPNRNVLLVKSGYDLYLSPRCVDPLKYRFKVSGILVVEQNRITSTSNPTFRFNTSYY